MLSFEHVGYGFGVIYLPYFPIPIATKSLKRQLDKVHTVELSFQTLRAAKVSSFIVYACVSH